MTSGGGGERQEGGAQGEADDDDECGRRRAIGGRFQPYPTQGNDDGSAQTGERRG